MSMKQKSDIEKIMLLKHFPDPFMLKHIGTGDYQSPTSDLRGRRFRK